MMNPLKSPPRSAEKVPNTWEAEMPIPLDDVTTEILDATEDAMHSSRARLERSLRWLARLKGLEFEDRAVALEEWVASEEAIAE